MSPQTLTAANFLGVVGGYIVAPTEATCNDSTYDCFVVATTIRHAVVCIQQLDDVGAEPPCPIEADP